MNANATTDDATEIAPLTDRDIESAAGGHTVGVETLREAVALAAEEITERASEIAETQVPKGHGKFSEPTVIHETDTHVCIYVEYGTLAKIASNHPDTPNDGDTYAAIGWAYNQYARRYGADRALEMMDALVLPRTDRVDEIIRKREEQTPAVGDYLYGESAIYVVTDRRPNEWKVALATELRRAKLHHDPSDAEGWQPAVWVDCHTVVDGEAVDSLTVSSGDRLRFDHGTLDDEPATAVVNVAEDGEVTLKSDGELVPSGYDTKLAVKCNIVTMELHHERDGDR